MSMREYAFSDYGLVLNGLVDDDLLQELAEKDGIEQQFSFTGEAFHLNDDGTKDWGHSDVFDGNQKDTVYYLAVSRRPSLFKAAYRSMASLVNDLYGKYKRLCDSEPRMPRLTMKQVREKLRAIDGTYYG